MERKKKKQKRHTITVNDETWKMLMTRKYPEDTWDELFQREILPVMDGPEKDAVLAKLLEKDPPPDGDGCWDQPGDPTAASVHEGVIQNNPCP